MSSSRLSTSNEKSRNLSEKRRRDQFNMLINELCSMVSTNSRKMDKTSVLKTTIAYLKAQKELAQQSLVHEIKEDWKPSFLSNDEFSQLVLESMNSFLLVFTQTGLIIYASESVTSLLNYLPGDLINHSVFEFAHASDRKKIDNLLKHRVVPGSDEMPDYEKEENQVVFDCHIRRCGDPGEAPIYELAQCRGTFRNVEWKNNTDDIDGIVNVMNVCFYCTVSIKNSQLIREPATVDESQCEFMSRHSLEWKFLFLDHVGPRVVGYLPYEVLGTSGYDYYHPDDLDRVAEYHKLLMQKGEGLSEYYRFLTKGQQWIWLQTHSYITYNHWNSKPEFIVCTNTVVSCAKVQAGRIKSKQPATATKVAQDFVPVVEPQSPPQTWDAPTSTFIWKRLRKNPPSESDVSSVVGTSDMVGSPPENSEVLPSTSKPATLAQDISPESSFSQQSLNIGAVDSWIDPETPMVSDDTTVCVVNPATPPVSSQSVMTPPPLLLSQARLQLQQQLLTKHRDLEEAIRKQQDQLRIISEQLLLASQIPLSLSSLQARDQNYGPTGMDDNADTMSLTDGQQQQQQQQQERQLLQVVSSAMSVPSMTSSLLASGLQPLMTISMLSPSSPSQQHQQAQQILLQPSLNSTGLALVNQSHTSPGLQQQQQSQAHQIQGVQLQPHQHLQIVQPAQDQSHTKYQVRPQQSQDQSHLQQIHLQQIQHLPHSTESQIPKLSPQMQLQPQQQLQQQQYQQLQQQQQQQQMHQQQQQLQQIQATDQQLQQQLSIQQDQIQTVLLEDENT